MSKKRATGLIRWLKDASANKEEEGIIIIYDESDITKWKVIFEAKMFRSLNRISLISKFFLLPTVTVLSLALILITYNGFLLEIFIPFL